MYYIFYVHTHIYVYVYAYILLLLLGHLRAEVRVRWVLGVPVDILCRAEQPQSDKSAVKTEDLSYRSCVYICGSELYIQIYIYKFAHI